MLPGYRSGNGEVEWQEIKAQELMDYLAKRNPAKVIDLRAPYERSEGYIPGALLIPFGELEAALPGLKRNKPYILVCHSGTRSRRAAVLMAKHGFQHLGVLFGGMDGWPGPRTR